MNSIKKTAISLATISVVTLSGCATSDYSSNANAASSSSATSASSREAELNRRAELLDAREAELNSRAVENVAAAGDLLPPNAAPGECYARVWVDAEYTTRSEQVLVSEASSSIKVIPAQYETVTETVEVSAASSRIKTIPAVYGTETETVKVSDGFRSWRVDRGIKSAPASAGVLATAAKHGIDLDNAEVGQCFHEHYVPETYKTVTQQVITRAATENVTIIPAEYAMVEETVLVREASTKLVEVPAEYEEVEQRIVDKPAHTIWKKGTGPIQRIDEATGEIMCLVEVPATYKTIKQSRLKAKAYTKTVEIPAEYKTVKVRKLVSAAREERTPVPAEYGTVESKVVDQESGFVWHEISNTDHPTTTRTGNKICLAESKDKFKNVKRTVVQTPARTETIEIPAEYKNVQVTKLVTPAREDVTVIPAVYRDVERRELVKDGYMAWRSILCETNMTRSRIADIQRALQAAGHNIGPNGADGVIGVDTIKAVNAFQRANDLPVDRYINIATLDKLGVSPR